jgi:hypothetical protein
MKILCHSMAKAVMQFWHSVELLLDKDVPDHNCIGGAVESEKVGSNEASRDERKNSEMVRVIFFDLLFRPLKKLSFSIGQWPSLWLTWSYTYIHTYIYIHTYTYIYI